MDEIAVMESIANSRRRLSGSLVRPFGITIMQLRLIRLARTRRALSPSQAATELECDRPTMTLLARKCVRAGWLSRRESFRDGRSSRLELSGEGEELLDRIEAARIFVSASFGDPLDILDPGEREAFARILEKIRRRSRELEATEGTETRADRRRQLAVMHERTGIT
ncbi:MAG: MarR family transcriptional regulator [Spirochaetes bacterium]|nr:MarR family transcriptional regulator [Spirochaetota bacterium]